MNYAGERINAFSLTDKQVEKTKETLGQIKESMIFR